METNVLSERLAIFRINYKSDFIITLNSDAGWMTPFCIKFWTGAPSQAYFAGWDGTTYTNCAPVQGNPTKLEVQFDDHHLPIGELKYQIGYHFTVADFPTTVEDEVLNQERVVIDHDGQNEKVLLDFNGETAPDIQFSLPAYANEAQRIANEEQRIANEAIRIVNEEVRIVAEQTRQQNEEQRIAQETARVQEFARLKRESESATSDANAAATLANAKAQLAADKAALAQSAADLANAKAQLAADKAALAASAAQLANDKAALAQQKAEYAQTQGTYAKNQGDYAKQQGDYAKDQGDTALADHLRAEADHDTAASDHTRAESDHSTASSDHTQAGTDHTRAESDHSIAASDHTTAGNDHTRAESDHSIAASDHTTAGNDHTRAESDHTRAESDHDAVELYVDSLGVFDLSKHNAVGGVLTTYANLSAAITALNALDSQYKYGGMSFKFVQSSDNKYVQYRLTSQNFDLGVGKWQGVDVTPTFNSNNLITSGGVYENILSINTKIDAKWMTINDGYVVAKYGTTVYGNERLAVFNDFQSYIKKIETVNLKGKYIGLSFIELKPAGIELYFKVFDSQSGEVTESANVYRTVAAIQDNGYCIPFIVDYRSHCGKIYFDSSILTYLSNIPSGKTIRIDGRDISPMTWKTIGLKNVVDITNPVFELGQCYLYNRSDVVASYLINSMIKDIVLPYNKMARLRYIEFIRNNTKVRFGIVLGNYNSAHTFDSDTATVVDFDIIADSQDQRKEIGSSGGYITVNTSKLVGESFTAANTFNNTACFLGTAFKEKVPRGDIFEKKNTIFSESGVVSTNSSYGTFILPVNKECRNLLINSTFDKYANVALLDSNGSLIKWLYQNGSGRKYDGEDTASSLSDDLNDSVRFIAVCYALAGGVPTLYIDNYNQITAVDSVNAAMVGKNGTFLVSCGIISKYNDNITVTDDNDYMSLPMIELEEQTESFVNPIDGKTYIYNSLCDIDGAGTKYFVGHSSSSNQPIFWKKTKDGVKSLLFYGDGSDSWKLKNGDGDTITFNGLSDYGWMWSFWQQNYVEYGIRCLPDGELLVYLLGNKLTDDNNKIEILCKSTNGQKGLSLKIIFSNEHFVRNNRTYSVVCYPANNNGIDIVSYDRRTCIAITEYGDGTPEYWFDQGIQKNGNGIAVKTYFSCDGGNTFFKILDFDQKINGDASDESDDNWRWAQSKAGKMAVHMHGVKFDSYVKKLFITNGDAGNTDVQDNLFYADIDNLIAYTISGGASPVDVTDIDPKYTDNEVLPSDTIMKRFIIPYTTFMASGASLQIWSMLAINNALICGHDTPRQLIYGFQHSTMNNAKASVSDIHIDILNEFDKSSPSQSINGLVEYLFRKDANSPILAYHTKKGVFASYNAIKWKKVFVDTDNTYTAFQGKFIKGMDGEIYLCKYGTTAEQGKFWKILNY